MAINEPRRSLFGAAFRLATNSLVLLGCAPAAARDTQPTDSTGVLPKAANLELMTDAGTIVLAQQEARLVYLDFWASWCAPCKLSFPWMQAIHDRYHDRGLRIIAVGLDKHRQDADRFLESSKPTFTLAFDPAGQSAKKMGLKTMPSAWLIRGKELQVLHHHAGFRQSDTIQLELVIQQLLAQKVLK